LNDKKLDSGIQELIDEAKTQPLGFLDYQELAMRTANPSVTNLSKIQNALLGLSGETGELADSFKKAFFQGHTLPTKEYVEKELGDILWYVALMAEAYDTDMLMIAIKNVDKLRQRYPEGFTPEASINRVEEAA
jgi:NTP pyrophosphatase (non-canonical NTP hydrolase)